MFADTGHRLVRESNLRVRLLMPGSEPILQYVPRNLNIFSNPSNQIRSMPSLYRSDDSSDVDNADYLDTTFCDIDQVLDQDFFVHRL